MMCFGSPCSRSHGNNNLKLNHMVLFTCNEGSATIKVAVMTRFSCCGNDVSEMTAR